MEPRHRDLVARIWLAALFSAPRRVSPHSVGPTIWIIGRRGFVESEHFRINRVKNPEYTHLVFRGEAKFNQLGRVVRIARIARRIIEPRLESDAALRRKM